jgi:phosphohistidine phosphatase
MRHAKSDWADSSLPDHDRPLNGRGNRDAPRMAAWLIERQSPPSVILCSTAKRTRETLALMVELWRTNVPDPIDSPPTITFTSELYLASPLSIWQVISRSIDAKGVPKSLLVLGHNPGMESLVSNLSGTELEMPTATIAEFHVPSFQFSLLHSRQLPESGSLKLECFTKPIDVVDS